ncbi:TPA: type IV toxin-antitoxin system YeeU family antitoxin [Yersinia enterocolitica]
MKSTDSENDSFLKWGLNRNVTPCFGARLVQEGNRLHYLADRTSITGEFNNAESLKLDEVFPYFISQMESMLRFATSPLDISSLSSSESANRYRFRTGGR